MSNKLQITFKTIFWMATALYLGYAFFDLFLKSFVLDTLAVPTVLLSAVGFFYVLRWLGAKEVAPVTATRKVAKPQPLKTGIFAPDQQHVFRVRKNKANCRRTAGNACMVQANHNA